MRRNFESNTALPMPELGVRTQGSGGCRDRARKLGFVMSAIVGVEGLEATYEAVRLAKRVGLGK